MIDAALPFAFGCVALALALNLFRLFRGPSLGDRIVALDTMVINVIALIVLIGIAAANDTYFEAGCCSPWSGSSARWLLQVRPSRRHR
jgi:multicomponent K+:H+ antiporter subunit F